MATKTQKAIARKQDPKDEAMPAQKAPVSQAPVEKAPVPAPAPVEKADLQGPKRWQILNHKGGSVVSDPLSPAKVRQYEAWAPNRGKELDEQVPGWRDLPRPKGESHEDYLCNLWRLTPGGMNERRLAKLLREMVTPAKIKAAAETKTA